MYHNSGQRVGYCGWAIGIGLKVEYCMNFHVGDNVCPADTGGTLQHITSINQQQQGFPLSAVSRRHYDEIVITLGYFSLSLSPPIAIERTLAVGGRITGARECQMYAAVFYLFNRVLDVGTSSLSLCILASCIDSTNLYNSSICCCNAIKIILKFMHI